MRAKSFVGQLEMHYRQHEEHKAAAEFAFANDEYLPPKIKEEVAEMEKKSVRWCRQVYG